MYSWQTQRFGVSGWLCRVAWWGLAIFVPTTRRRNAISGGNTLGDWKCVVCSAGAREFLLGLEDTRNTRATRSVVSYRPAPVDGWIWPGSRIELTHHIPEKSYINYNPGYTYPWINLGWLLIFIIYIRHGFVCIQSMYFHIVTITEKLLVNICHQFITLEAMSTGFDGTKYSQLL